MEIQNTDNETKHPTKSRVPKNNIGKCEDLKETVKRVIRTWNEKDQLNFLKIYPSFKIELSLVHIWIDVYNKYNNHKSKLRIDNTENIDSNDKIKLLSRNESFVHKKNSIIKFLIIGITREYFQIEIKYIGKIMTLMKNANENSKHIEAFKLSLVKSGIANNIEVNNLLFSSSTILPKSNITTNNNIKIESDDTISNTIHPIDSSQEHLPLIDFILIPTKDIVFELTRMNSELMLKMNIHEIIQYSMSDSCNPHFHPNLSKYILNFNKLCNYIGYKILVEIQNVNDRIQFIKKIIDIATESKIINNFFGFFALIIGLGNSNIQKISELWDSKRNYTKKFREFEKFISPLKNFSNYDIHIKKLETTSVIPYIIPCIYSIKHLLEFNIYDKETNMIDWNVYNKLSSIINFYESMNKVYVIPINKSICNFFNTMPNYEDYENKISVKPAPTDSTFKINTSKKNISKLLFTSSKNLNVYPIKNEISTSDDKTQSCDSNEKLQSNNSSRKLQSNNSSRKLRSNDSNRKLQSNDSNDKMQSNDSNGKMQSFDQIEEHQKPIKISTPHLNHSPTRQRKTNNYINENEQSNLVNMFTKYESNTNNIKTEVPTKRLHSSIKSLNRNITHSEHNGRPRHMSVDLTLLLDEHSSIKIETPRNTRSPRSSRPRTLITQSSQTVRIPRKSQSFNNYSSEINKYNMIPMSKWKSVHVAQWLKHIGMNEYVNIFLANQIDGFCLLSLDETHLDKMNITVIGHQIRILKLIQQFRECNIEHTI